MPVLSSARRVLGAVAALALVAVVSPLAPAGARPAAPPRPAGAVAVSAPAPAPVPADARWGEFVDATDTSLRLTQPDGTLVHAKLTDAAVGGALEVGGFSIVKDGSGWWRYAAARGASGLEAGPARVGVDAPPAGLAAGIGRIADVWQRGDGTDVRAELLRQLQTASREASLRAAAGGGPRVFRFPVVLFATWYDPELGQTAPQFQEGNGVEHYEAILDGFGGNPTGTLTEFYFENSFGQFIVQVDVFGPYPSQRSRQDRCYYGGADASADPADDLDPFDSVLGIGGLGAIGMGVEAVPQADADVDFTQYDNDGDGFVDFTAILHSGPDMAATGDPCHTWSHAIEAGVAGPVAEQTLGLPHNTLQHGIPTTDGVLVNRLFTMPEIDLEIGVATHEMAHALGEPDYYNPSYTSMGTGDWDIMAGGSWFGNPPGSNPTHFNPASRVFQGWITPKIVTGDERDVRLAPRELQPFPNYTADKADPNIILVPTKTIAVGETDETEHVWTQDDVYGLVKTGDRYVIEGYYLENWSRSINAPAFDSRLKRSPYFDRQALGSGLLVWHFDYVRRSNTYYGGNDAGSDPNRPQMDPIEFDFNDNTQELQLGLTRGEPQDLVVGAATGITSGTRQTHPGIPTLTGTPQAAIAWSGDVPPTESETREFTVDVNEANHQMRVNVQGTGDCTLQLTHDGEPVGDTVDDGFAGDPEFVDVIEPAPGKWAAVVGDFAACGGYDARVEFSLPDPVYDTKGAGDTWSNWTEQPTGWAFTNVRPAPTDGIGNALDSGDGVITLDLLKMTDGATDVSAGFVRMTNLDAGRSNIIPVPVFNNGDVAVGSVGVQVRLGSSTGPLIANGTVSNLAPYSRSEFGFEYTPSSEGPLAFVVTVDPANALGERSERNNTERTVVNVSPAGGRVLVVDDDGGAASEETVVGALDALDIPYDVVVGHTDADTMRRYAAVIWEAGLERYQGQMDADDRAAVAAYLDGGGRFLFASPRAVSAIGEPAGSTNPLQAEDAPQFLADYFGATWVDTMQVGGGTVTGTGDALGADSFEMGVFAGRPLQDVFAQADSTKGTSVPLATWSKGGEGSLMGVRVEGNAEHGAFRSVLLGFNPSQVLGADAVVNVLERSLGYLGVTGGGYPQPAKTVVHHAAVRNAVAGAKVEIIAFVSGGGIPTPTLSYRRHGDGAFVTIPMAQGRRGVFQATIPGDAVRVDGVDYVINAGAGRSPFTNELRHYISVGLPL